MLWVMRRRIRFFQDRRGFTRLEFSLLTGMLFAMIINGIATLGGGLGGNNRPMGTPVADDVSRTVADIQSTPRAAPHP